MSHGTGLRSLRFVTRYLRLAALVALGGALPALAQWPQWGGPNRDFKSSATGLADRWPADGPRKLWARDLGDGFSSLAVADGRIYTMKRKGDQEVAVALDLKTGETLWEHAYAAPFETGMEMEFGPGPHSTPLVAGDCVYTVGVLVDVHCFDAQTGAVRWQRALRKEIEAPHLGRGFGASPMAYKDLVILPVGAKGKAIMAFDAKSGETRWAAHDFEAAYASPIVIQFGGRDQLITFTGGEISGLNPDTGELLWSHPYKTQYGANISTPVWTGDGLLFCSAAYGSGSRVIRLKQAGEKTVPEEVWASRKMSIHFGDAVRSGDFVYGSSGDFGPAFLMCVNVNDGEVAWKERAFKKANVLYADGKLIVLDEDGVLALLKCGPEKCEILSQVQLLQRVAWTVPAMADRTLLVRDRKTIMALDLAP